MANARHQAAPAPQPFADSAPRHTRIDEFDVPNEDGLWSEVTKDFGSIRTVGMQLLSPLQQKHAIAAAKSDPLQMGFELARRAIAYVKSDVGGREEIFRLAEHDGSSAACWAQMHPSIRTLCIQANNEISTPSERAQTSFLASRRIIAG